MFKLICAFFLVFAVMACSVKKEESKEVLLDDGTVGPFVINFGGGDSYQNSFDVKINQAEGKVEYSTLAADKGKVRVEDFKATVTGCDGSSMQAYLLWFEDAASDVATPLMIGSEFEILEKKGKVLLVFQGIGGCQGLQVKLKLKKAEINPPPPPPTGSFPEDLLGDWNKRTESFGYVFELKMNLTKNAQNQVKMTYFTNCGNGTEGFKGTVVASDGTTDPKRFSVVIDEVTKEFSGGCGNIFALRASDKGKYINCLGEKNAEWSTFQLACSLKTAPDVYPLDWNSADIHWQ